MPSFEVKHTAELKTWLVNELEPICDADPEVLSDYVLALLRHDATDGDLQNLLQEQLDDFLAEKTAAFVAKTMGALKAQSYLPANLRPSTSSQSLSHGDAPSSSSRKRTAEDEGRRSPAKMHRAPDEAEGSERIPRGPNTTRGDNRDHRKDRGPKPACRDFHLRGFCPRGDDCRYDHTIPAPDFALNPMVKQQSQPFPMQGMHPQQMQQMYGISNQGGFPSAQHGQPFWPANGNGNGMDMNGMSANGNEGGTDLGARLGAQQPMEVSGMHNQANTFREGGFREGGRGARGGRGGARGTFERRPTSNTTLVIENVPVENLDLIKINEYFKKFGTITNIQIDAETKKALVSYSQPSEAKAAHTSPEVIFNNRFVKVYFQKLDDPGIGAKPKEVAPQSTGPPLKSNFIPGQTSNKFVRADLPQSKTKEAQEAASKKLDTLMAEQKEIMTKLTTASTAPEEKKALMIRFSALEREIKAATEEVRNAVGTAQAKEAGATTSAEAGSKWKDQKMNKEKEQLDRELEALNKTSSGSTTEELKAHLAKLQEEAAKLGIDAEAAAAGRGGYRGRARAAYRGASIRGYSSYNARGRGGIAGRSTMSLDNRPTKLAVTEVPEESAEKAKEHFKQFGDVESIEDKDSGAFTVHYKARLGGERALRAGLDIPGVGQVKASWLVEGSSNKGEGGAGNAEQGDAVTMAEEGGYEEDGDRDDHFRR